MARLSERDAREWHAIGQRVSHEIEPRLGPRVLANRAGVGLGRALSRVRSAARSLAARGDVLRTDVCAFYPSVSPSVAFRSLVDLGVEDRVASRAATLLDAWGSEGYAGLPIGPPASATIANAVLAPVDEELRPFPFLRWVDDYLIAARERDVPLVIERTDAVLSRLGLDRSIPKTEMLSGGSSVLWPGTYLRLPPSQ
jgi:hypothetical protein